MHLSIGRPTQWLSGSSWEHCAWKIGLMLFMKKALTFITNISNGLVEPVGMIERGKHEYEVRSCFSKSTLLLCVPVFPALQFATFDNVTVMLWCRQYHQLSYAALETRN